LYTLGFVIIFILSSVVVIANDDHTYIIDKFFHFYTIMTIEYIFIQMDISIETGFYGWFTL